MSLDKTTSPFFRLHAVRRGALALFGAIGFSLPAIAQEEVRWAGYLVDTSGYVDTADSFLGRTAVGRNTESSWIFSEGIDSYFYLPEPYVREAGAWAYSVHLNEDIYDYAWRDLGWIWARNSGTWAYVYNIDQALEDGHGWVFLNYGAEIPEHVLVTSDFSAEMPVGNINLPNYLNARPATTEELARFDDALRLGIEDLKANMEVGTNVTFTESEDGLTFTNDASFGNRAVRFFYHPIKKGLLDFSALGDLTGEIGITVHAEVDLSGDTGGFYSRTRNNGIADIVEGHPEIPDYILEFYLELRDVASFSRLEKGADYGAVLLENHALQAVDDAFIELTLPVGTTVTVKEVFLNLVPVIRGFADMEERITGGEGATAENTYTVTNVPEMQAAIEAVEAADEPSIIYVDGLMSLDDWEGANGESQQFDLGSNFRDASIIGVEDRAILDGMGFKIHGTNIIIENLTVKNAWMQDAMEINDAKYVRISHNEMYGDLSQPENRFDEFMSVKNSSRYVIISWNYLHDDINGRGILIGSNDGVEAMPDRSVIIHHNWFQNNGSRHPLVRGGYSHIYNNYFDNVGWASNVRTRARTRIEGNYFENVDRAIFAGEAPPEIAGGWELIDNIYDGGNTSYQPSESTATLVFEEDYDPDVDPAEDVPSIVTAGAGIQTTDE